jgi:hypothetical protein
MIITDINIFKTSNVDDKRVHQIVMNRTRWHVVRLKVGFLSIGGRALSTGRELIAGTRKRTSTIVSEVDYETMEAMEVSWLHRRRKFGVLNSGANFHLHLA